MWHFLKIRCLKRSLQELVKLEVTSERKAVCVYNNTNKNHRMQNNIK